MKGILLVDLPSSCKECQYFNTILNEPLTICFSDGTKEVVSGACKCNIVQEHRLKPMDNGVIMEQLTVKAPKDFLPPHTVSRIHNGRPSWCPIKERSEFFESQNVEQGNSSQGVFNSSQREERSN